MSSGKKYIDPETTPGVEMADDKVKDPHTGPHEARREAEKP